MAAVRAAGYRYVTLDLEGLRSGNLNAALAGEAGRTFNPGRACRCTGYRSAPCTRSLSRSVSEERSVMSWRYEAIGSPSPSNG